MNKEIQIFQINASEIKDKFPKLVLGQEVDAYDISQMTLNQDDTAVGDLYKTRISLPSFENNPSHVMNVALHLYEKHAFLTSNDYRADLYDVGNGWVNDVHKWDGGFYCPLTNSQIKNLRTLRTLDDHVWDIKVKLDRVINVTLNESDQKWLRNTWDLEKNEDGIRDFLDRAPTSLNRVVSSEGKGYISVYVKKGQSPRTLFEFQNKNGRN